MLRNYRHIVSLYCPLRLRHLSQRERQGCMQTVKQFDKLKFAFLICRPGQLVISLLGATNYSFIVAWIFSKFNPSWKFFGAKDTCIMLAITENKRNLRKEKGRSLLKASSFWVRVSLRGIVNCQFSSTAHSPLSTRKVLLCTIAIG